MLRIEYEDVKYEVDGDGFVIGREGDLPMGDNPYLHRNFLEIRREDGLWWLGNVGRTLSATVCDPRNHMEAWLRPGARLPLVFGRVDVLFTAGPLSYTLAVINDEPLWKDNLEVADTSANTGTTTMGACTWTPAQRLAVLALAEPLLLRDSPQGFAHLPSNIEAAKRIGWSVKRFEKKIDNICAKLDQLGVEGVRGGIQEHAASRRSRLVEWATSTGLVTTADLVLLTNPSAVVDED